MNQSGDFIEVQGTGEKATFDRGELDQMLDLAVEGIQQLISLQNSILK